MGSLRELVYSNSSENAMLLPLEAYFSHHKEEDSSVFHCFLKKKKLSAVQSIYDPSFLSFSRYLFSSSLFLLIESREKIHRTQSWTFYRNVQKTFFPGFSTNLKLSGFLLENFVLDAMLGLRNMEVLWQTQKASQAYFKCG